MRRVSLKISLFCVLAASQLLAAPIALAEQPAPTTAPPGTWQKTQGVVPANQLITIDIPTVKFTDIMMKEETVAGKPVKTIDVPWMAQYISGLYKYSVQIAGVIAAVMMIIGGVLYLTAGGDAGRVSRGKERITDAILGLLLIFTTYAILSIVNPDLTSMGGTRITTIKQTLFVKNETDITQFNPADYSGGAAGGDVPLFKQCSSVGQNTPYINSNKPPVCDKNPAKGTNYSICSSGCGISSAAMVISKYTGRSPDSLVPELAKMSTDNGGRNCSSDCKDCGGTAFQPLMSANDKTFGKYNMVAEWANGQSKIIELLKQGKPVIALVGPSIFTSGGHYIVLTGIDSSGKIIVNDPFLSVYKKNLKDGTPIDPPITDGHVPQDLIFPYLKVGINLHPK